VVNLQEKRLVQEIGDIEKDTGFKLRVLAQNYPETPGMLSVFDLLVVRWFAPSIYLLILNIPFIYFNFSLKTSILQAQTKKGFIINKTNILVGLAIKDFWQVDDRTIVFVADPTFGKGFKHAVFF